VAYQTNVSSRHDEGNASNRNERELPAVRETNDGTTNQARNALHDTTANYQLLHIIKSKIYSRAKRYTSQTADLLRVVGQRRGKSTSLHQKYQ
jgi:hypothetical protein